MIFPILLVLLFGCFSVRGADLPSIARIWDEEILSAIRIDLPNPPVHARNLFHFSVAMYDAWAAYDTNAVGLIYHRKHTANDIEAARREAISYAAYRILRERYSFSKAAGTSLAAFDARMAALGYLKSDNSLDPSTGVGVGNTVAAAVSGYYFEDGALQARSYQDYPPEQGGYQPVNLPLLIAVPGTLADNINRWQPLAITDATSQNGIPVDSIQKFVGSQWRATRPFALTRDHPSLAWIDPGPPPQLGGSSDAAFRSNVVEVIRRSSELTTEDGTMIDISPASFGNNSLGTNDGKGHTNNPVTGSAYVADIVPRGDFTRVLAEFWADGPTSETPPGHWNTIANAVADSPSFQRRVGGIGPSLSPLEWDIKMYFALNAAVHDAACAAWTVKRVYDGWRPMSAIRFMGQFGQSSNLESPSYHRLGLPLIPGLIEEVTPDTASAGGRHEGLAIGQIVIHTWPGQPADPKTQVSGVHWIYATRWFPFQKKTFVTPAFPGYISGHSTFSRAAAEVLTAMTGSSYFPGGLGVFKALAGSLSFEVGPTRDVQLQWATYYDAADQAGLSRIWGGIHPPADDFAGRKVGSQCGILTWALAQQYFNGSILQSESRIAITGLPTGTNELRWTTTRAMIYTLQSSANISGPWNDEPGTPFRALDSSYLRADGSTNARQFYRLLRGLE